MKYTTFVSLIALATAQLTLAQDNYILTTPLDLTTTGGIVRAVLPDAAGNLYMSIDNQVRKYAPDGSFYIVAGTTSQGYNGDGQAANLATLSTPMGLALDGAGNLYIADNNNGRVRMVSPSGIISTIAGGGNGPAGGPANGASLINPSSVAADASGNLFITAGLQIFKVSGDVITIVVNQTRRAGFAGDGGPATQAWTEVPADVKVDANGTLYFVDTGNNRVRKVSPSGIISTIAGMSQSGYNGDNQPAVNAWLKQPTGLAVDGSGNVYIGDTQGFRIRKISTQGIITTIAGTGVRGFNGVGGSATLAQLFNPAILNVDGHGNVYCADELRAVKLSQFQIYPGGVLNAASAVAGPVAPGEVISIFGSNIGPTVFATAQLDFRGRVTTTLAGTQVLFDGIPAPLLFVRSDVVNAVVPYEIAGKPTTNLTIQYNGEATNTVTLPVATASPALFTLNGTGKGPGVILNQDYSLNTASNGAAQGSVIFLYATGQGQTQPGGIDGTIPATVFPAPALPVTVTIGGVPAQVIYAGAAPGMVSGVLQLNVQIPYGVASGTADVVVTIGTIASAPGVTVAVR